MNQTRIIATATGPRGEPVEATVIVDSGKLEEASAEAWDGLSRLVLSVLTKKGAQLDTVTWTAHPIGPQLRLVTVNGARL